MSPSEEAWHINNNENEGEDQRFQTREFFNFDTTEDSFISKSFVKTKCKKKKRYRNII